jgi:FMN-dependent NADH-azoreductase
MPEGRPPTRLLHLDASPRGERSRSREVAGHFLAALAERQPGLEVERLDLWSAALPELGGGMIEGRYALIMGEAVPAPIAADWQRVRAVADHFLAFDAYLVSTPMWNFGVPYRLKHYVDVVTQPGMAFSNDAAGNVVGHGAGKRAAIIGASAMDRASLAALDFQIGYLAEWLRFIGLETIRTLRVAPTFGPAAAVAAAMEDGRRAARALAQGF